MSFDYFDRYFALAAAGLGILLAGGLNLTLGRGGRRVWLRLAGTLAACGLVCAALGAITRPELALLAAEIQAAVLMFVVLFGSAWVARQVAALVAVLRKPGPRWGLVAAGGLGVVLASGLAFDRADKLDADQNLKNLEMAAGRPPTRANDETPAATDGGTRIILKEPIDARDDAELVGPEEHTLHGSLYHDQTIRRGDATDHSNCHGWVFTGGKFLLGPDDVETIVKENGYHETHEPHPGDLVVYRQGGAVAHTAVVRYVSEGQPVLVEGKWGTMGVFLHPADKSFYGTDYTFYRSARAGHLLVGVGGTSPNPSDAGHAATE